MILAEARELLRPRYVVIEAIEDGARGFKVVDRWHPNKDLEFFNSARDATHAQYVREILEEGLDK
jgi:hypothetical protein